MIKCNVTVCGTISRSAQMRTGKEGKPFMSLGINVVIPAKSGINKTVEISVAKDGGSQEELANFPVAIVSRWLALSLSTRKEKLSI